VVRTKKGGQAALNSGQIFPGGDEGRSIGCWWGRTSTKAPHCRAWEKLNDERRHIHAWSEKGETTPEARGMGGKDTHNHRILFATPRESKKCRSFRHKVGRKIEHLKWWTGGRGSSGRNFLL